MYNCYTYLIRVRKVKFLNIEMLIAFRSCSGNFKTENKRCIYNRDYLVSSVKDANVFPYQFYASQPRAS